MNDKNGIIDASGAEAAPDQAGKAPKRPAPAAARKVPAPLLAAAGAAALAAMCAVGLMAGAGAGGSTAGNVTDPEPAAEAPQIAVPDEGPASEDAGEAAEAAEASHTWRPVYEEAAAEARTRVEHVEATYREVTELETLCNECKQDVTGHAAEHSEQTGHVGFTTNVPVQKTVVDVPAHDETVTEAPAGTVKRLAGYACACGKSLTVDEAKRSGVWSADDEPQ